MEYLGLVLSNCTLYLQGSQMLPKLRSSDLAYIFDQLNPRLFCLLLTHIKGLWQCHLMPWPIVPCFFSRITLRHMLCNSLTEVLHNFKQTEMDLVFGLQEICIYQIKEESVSVPKQQEQHWQHIFMDFVSSIFPFGGKTKHMFWVLTAVCIKLSLERVSCWLKEWVYNIYTVCLHLTEI